MILGPVFHAELVTTSRRRRYYAARLAYGLTLLALVGWTYEEASRDWASMSHPGAPGFAFLADHGLGRSSRRSSRRRSRPCSA